MARKDIFYNDSERAKVDKINAMLVEIYGGEVSKPYAFADGEFIHKFGENADIDTGTTPETIWPVGGTITWPSSAATASITSSSTNDDGSPAGTGAQTVYIQGVDGSFGRINETITMNGTTAVTSTNSYLFIDRMYVVASGSLETNDGNITAQIGGNTVAYIGAGDGQTLQAAMIIPTVTGKSPYLLHIWAGVGRATIAAYARLQLCRQSDGGSRRVNDDVTITNTGDALDLAFETPVALAAGDRFWWECIEVSANNLQVYAGFEIGWL